MGRLGMTDTLVGDSLIEDRKSNEACYYLSATSTWDTLYDTLMAESGRVLYPYGAQTNVRQRAASGGWLSSAADMARYAYEMFHAPSPQVLSVVSRSLLSSARYCWSGGARPCSGTGQGLAWSVLSDGTMSKSGHLNGTAARIGHYGSAQGNAAGSSFFYVFNRDASHATYNEDWFSTALATVLDVTGAANAWGTDDCFTML